MKKNFKVNSLKCREILDSRGNPTVEVDLQTELGIFRSSCPSGASKGEDEAVFIRNVDEYFGSLSVKDAVRNARRIGKKIIKAKPTEIEKVDEIIKEEDGTKNFGKIGVNAALPPSLSYFRFFSYCEGLNLVDFIAKSTKSKRKMPKIFFNVINGGKHAGNELEFQEILVCLPGKNCKKCDCECHSFFCTT